ncbi:hypothetical protein, conserved [Eimeria praecox]|uniref:Uncharacterized protein n=1 Tax=Eimeria praecox TaxID=51316 RepID=U6H2S9_9EIME|nr:hypothetical protein, conserved [Eimeria praecox]
MQHATAEAVNLLLEDIDALATENALLTVLRNTEQVAALQASLRESGDRFAFLQSLAQQQQQQHFDGEFVESTDLHAAAAQATIEAADGVTARSDKPSWESVGGLLTTLPNECSTSRVPAVDEELPVLLRMRPLQSQQQLVEPQQQLQQHEDDFEVPTEEQELECIESNSEQQQQQQQLQEQPLALQPQGLIRNKGTLQFDEYFSPQSISAADCSPSRGPAPGAAVAAPNDAAGAAPTAPATAGGGRSLGFSPFRFFGRSGAFGRLYSTSPVSLNPSATAGPLAVPAAGAAATAAAASPHADGDAPGSHSKGPVKG